MITQLPILVTGASGFLGSQVTKGLLRKGFPLYIAGRGKIALPPGSNMHFVTMDLLHDFAVDFFDIDRFRSVVHLA